MGRLKHHYYYFTSLLAVLGLTFLTQPTFASDLNKGYIIELARPPQDCASLLHDVEVRYQYDSDVFYGASIITPSGAIADHVFSHPDVINIWPIRHHSRPYAQERPHQLIFDPDTPNVIPTLTEDYRPIRSANGTGINIGIIDSGVDYFHPALGGCFGPGCKIAYGYDLVGDDYDGSPWSIRPDDNPLERCPSNEPGATGHGTFVSGLIGALDSKYNWTGAAPEATLGMWRVFSCKAQTTTTDIFMKAMEMAYKAKMDILSLSFGEHGGWSEDPLSVFADRLVARGIHVVVASGNIGTNGVMLTASPATATNVVAVGSVGSKYLPAFLLSVTRSDLSIPYRTNVDQPVASNVTYSLMSISKTFGSPEDGCKSIRTVKKKNTALLIYGDTSACSLAEKLAHAEAAGAAAALVYTDSNDTVMPEAVDGRINVTVAFINRADGKKIFKAISRRHGRHARGVKFTQAMVALPSPASIAGRVLSFSSLGPTNNLEIKPEIVAAGGDLFSTLPSGGYGIVSGTSMSTPLVAGAIALYLDATGNKHQDPKLVKTALMNYAQPVSSPITQSHGYGDAPIRQGAGKLNIKRAIDGSKQFHVSPAKLSFNDTEHLIKRHTLTVHNHQTDKNLTLTLVHGAAQTVYGYDPATHIAREPILFATRDNTTASIRFSSETIFVRAGKSAKVCVTIVPPTNAERNAIYGGYIGFRSSDGSLLSASVPYTGMVGNMSDLPILDRSSSGVYPFPSVGKPDGTIQRKTEVVSYGPGYWPTLLLRLLTGTPEIVFEVYNADENKKIGTIPYDPATRLWMPRNTLSPTPSSNVYELYEWQGDYLPTKEEPNGAVKKVNDGEYRIKIRARHVFSTSQWDEWTSPVMAMYTNTTDASPASTTETTTTTTSSTTTPHPHPHPHPHHHQRRHS